MKVAKLALTGLLVGVAAGTVAALYSSSRRRAENQKVPDPSKAVDLNAYAGLWYEVGRYENPFEAGYEGVTDHYALTEEGDIKIQATLHKDTADGPERKIPSKAKVVPGSGNAKWKVSFFGPFYLGDYWVMDHAEDYTWTIVGEPTGKLLWVMTRDPHPVLEIWSVLQRRVAELGYNWANVRKVAQPVEGVDTATEVDRATE
ncbi:lipocalin family protein [Asticcacaulis taihuensis]|uniref:Outer membrane lipoprotein Blc n=1 Tax=Asticcacaulis taihuensis TaxID=260084 RepID=A0A1G4PX17_9CAUL|nr:lipocalin family protein [Asticcacaulis taihuensis]SCW36559.1 apolipoprotein D and lipocalin family protein [Asticcacaulis taihuensis]